MNEMDEATVRGLREKLGMRRSELARALSVHPRTIARWEDGKTQPHPIFLARMRAMLFDAPKLTAVMSEADEVDDAGTDSE